MNPDAQAELDMADMILNDPDPDVRRSYLAAFADDPDLPRKRRPMPADPNDFLMGGPPPDQDDDTPPFVTAKYDGRCSACEEWHILAGDTKIRSDGSGGWEAEECAW